MNSCGYFKLLRGFSLPIDAVLDEVKGALVDSGAVVVVAPPGSGKTTRVPPALLARPGRIVVLQPRRVAARLAARRVAMELGDRVGGLGEKVGRTVGYSVRHERRVGPQTRIEFLTEGLLTRRLQADPFLEGIGTVVLDEFHERSLHADLALGLLQEVRSARDDLGVVVMSATLDPAPLAAFLGDCPVVVGEGRPHPVTCSWEDLPDDRPLTSRVARAVRQRLTDGEGDVLVFLPGVRELEDCADALAEAPARVLLLHGRQRLEDQEAALAGGSERRVILATNLAETSVTVPGVRHVVDAGLARVPRFDPALGLTRLETVRSSRASAEQRAGRAGRLGPGHCHRLWPRSEEARLRAFEEPALAREDLASTVLQLLAWGAEPETFRWFEAPPAAHLAQARATLEGLGATKDGALTPTGEALAALPVEPRLGRVVLEGHARGCLAQAAALAALASERDLLPGDDSGSLERRLAALQQPGRGVHRRALQQVRAARDQLIRGVTSIRGPAHRDSGSEEDLARALLAGLPDRVARRRGPGDPRCLLASGAGATAPASAGEWFLAVVVTAGRRGVRSQHVVRAALDLDPAWLPVQEAGETTWDAEAGRARGARVRRVGAIELDRQTAPVDPVEGTALLLAAARSDPVRALEPSKEALALQARLLCLRDWRPDLDLPDPAWPGLLSGLCAGRRSFAELRQADLISAQLDRLDWSQRRALDTLAPASLTLPSGSSRRLRYAPGEPPVLSARIQQCFGWRSSPTVCAGRVPVLLELLAPSQRPVQRTADLESFWANTWPEVRKELRGRYPKHPWPEDPSQAQATDRAKPRKR